MGNMLKTSRKIRPEIKAASGNTSNSIESTNHACNNSNPMRVEIQSKKQIVPEKVPQKDSNFLYSDSIVERTEKASRFLVPLEDVRVTEGDSVSLICRVEPNFPGKICWYKNGVLIQNGDNGCTIEREPSGWNRLNISNTR